MKALSLRLSIGVLFALVGLFLGLFATARPLNDATLRRFNDATDRQQAPFPTIQIQPVASDFASPVTVTNAGDGSGRLFIVERFGRIQIFVNGTVLPTPFLDIHELVTCCGEQALLGLAFHPDYANNGFFWKIDFQLAASIGGENYGWDVLEAMQCYEDDPPGSCNQFLNGGSTLPVLEYSHSLGCAVTGGYRYRGQLYPSSTGSTFTLITAQGESGVP